MNIKDLNVSAKYDLQDYSVIVLPYPLAEGMLKELLGDLKELASDGFKREVTAQRITGFLIVPSGALFLALFNGKLVGFASIVNLPSEPRSIYLDGIAIDQENQFIGLGSFLLATIICETNCNTIFLHTQSPVMYCLLRKFCTSVYPNTVSAEIPENIKVRAKRFGEKHLTAYNEETLVIKDLYPQVGGLYPTEFPWCRDAGVNLLFHDALDFTDGRTNDGFNLVGIIDESLVKGA